MNHLAYSMKKIHFITHFSNKFFFGQSEIKKKKIKKINFFFLLFYPI
jgi:hypothetical protein